MSRLIAKSNKILQFMLRQKGQGLTEFVLILAFCAAIGWGANEVGLMDTIGAVFETSKRPENITAAIGGGGTKKDAYVSILEQYGNNPMGRRALVNLVKDGNNYVLGEDIVPNETRVAADRKALENIAGLFLGMNYQTMKSTVFKNEGVLNDNWYRNGGPKGDGILLLDYRDYGYVENNYDNDSGSYSKGTNANLELGTGGRKFTPNDIIHWMQGDYGSYKDPDASYDSSKDFKANTRYFFSNEMINLNKYEQWGGGERRNIRVRFKFSDNTNDCVVTGIELRLQHNGRDFDNLIVTAGDY